MISYFNVFSRYILVNIVSGVQFTANIIIPVVLLSSQPRERRKK